MNKKLLLSATALAVVLPMLDNDAGAMMAERVEPVYNNPFIRPAVDVLGGPLSQEEQAFMNEHLSHQERQAIAEVHRNLSPDGQKAHNAMLKAIMVGRNGHLGMGDGFEIPGTVDVRRCLRFIRS